MDSDGNLASRKRSTRMPVFIGGDRDGLDPRGFLRKRTGATTFRTVDGRAGFGAAARFSGWRSGVPGPAHRACVESAVPSECRGPDRGVPSRS